jgi:hypothetical protein
MIHASRRVQSPEDVDALFAEGALAEALRGSSGVLVQIFWNGTRDTVLGAVLAAVMRRAPGATIVGAGSAGQVAAGRLVPEGIVVSVSCFAGATVKPFGLEATPGREAEAGRMLAESLAACADIKAALVFTPTSAIDASAMLHSLREGLPSLALFGGGSIEGPGSGVLFGDRVSERGLAAVALCGSELRVDIRSLFDWRPLGPAAVLTEVRDGRIRSIDGKGLLVSDGFHARCLQLDGAALSVLLAQIWQVL